MSVRNLDAAFKPESIALIGASQKPRSVGQVLARNLFSAGFQGPIMPVNPKRQAIEGVLCYPDIDHLPLTPDLAVISTPPHTVPEIVGKLGDRGTRAAVIISAGFGELGAEGKALEQQVLDAARRNMVRLVGPNCLGIMVPGIGLNGSFVHVHPAAGDIALVAQSGAVLTSVVDWATARRIGFSHLVSLGGMADVDFGDMLDYLAADHGTRAILLYIEAVTNARKFLSAARAAARIKPVIVIKAGRSPEAAEAASSHTGALAGSDRVYDAAFARAGMLRVDTLDELFDAVETLAKRVKVTGDRLAIISNGGGIGVLATDALIREGGQLASLSPSTLDKLNGCLPPTWSKGNPIDIIGDAPGQRYADTLAATLEEPNADAFLVLNCPTAIADSTDAARATIDAATRTRKPLLTSWLGDGTAGAARSLFAEQGVPTYATPEQAVRGFMHMVTYRRNQDLLMETPASVPDSFTVDRDRADAIIQGAVADGREWLDETEAKAVLDAYGITIARTEKVATPDEAAEAAGRIPGPYAVKILSPDLTHKSDVGGVALNLDDAEAVRRAAGSMLERIGKSHPHARIDGFSVQEMVRKQHAQELIIGASEDTLFGPVILFGQGGTKVEVVDDQALALPPLNMKLAHDLMERTRVDRLLKGYRAHPPADRDAIAHALIQVAQLVTDLELVRELDINPLLAGSDGVVALDARIRAGEPRREGRRRLAIRPYPRELEKEVAVLSGRRFLIRPIRPEDEPLVQDMVAETTPEDLRLRFFAPMRVLSHRMAARLTQIDYEREMALVAQPIEDTGPGGSILGVVRISADPDNERAEYGVLVRSDMKGQGLGYALMNDILNYARDRGIGAIHGEVLRENNGMLRMCEELGFTRRSHPDESGIYLVEKILRD